MTIELSSLEDMAREIRDGTASVRGIVDAAIANRDARDLGAYQSWNGKVASECAGHVDALIAAGYDTGPLMGMPCSVKDLYGVPGLPVFAGTDADLGQDWQRAGPVVAALMGQLGIVMGKTHTVEMAFGGIGANAHWAAPVNPWGGGDRIPGGSSSGAGVSLAEGSAVLALGTDTAGSVRIPASVTGNVGLKITHGRWSLDGIVPLSPSFDTPGLLCRTVADIAYAFAALDPLAKPAPVGRDVGGLRIGVLGGVAAQDVDAEIGGAVAAALASLERHGAALTPASLPEAEPALALFRQGGLAASELAAFMQERMPERIDRLDPRVRARVEGAAALTATDYLRRSADFRRMARQTAARDFEGCDLLACATVAISPPVMAALSDPDAYAKANMMVLRNTAIVNLLGLCAITMPVGLDRNAMPVGLMLIAPPGRDRDLISAALGIERVIGTGAQLLGRPG